VKEFPKSQRKHDEALRLLVGGVNSPVRSFKRVGGTPLLASHAEGAHLWDLDGNKYIDLVMSYGPHLFGHGKKQIVEAVTQTAQKGLCLGMTSQGEIEWAESFLAKVPSAQKVRCMSSGTEACMTAVRLARGYTGRDLIVKCSGHYHGHVDSLMVDAGSGVATLSEEVAPDSAGLPRALTECVRVVEFNNVQSVKEVFAKDGERIAGLILEPVMGNMGVVAPEAEFLTAVREETAKAGALLIFDEVMTGFRVHEYSAQGRYGIVPDLSTFGKIVGGGMPLSALTGSAQVMDKLAPLGSVYQAGTLSGNPVGIEAGRAMLSLLEKENPYGRLEELGAWLENLLAELAMRNSLKLSVARVGSMISVFFREKAPRNAAETRDVDFGLFNRFFWALIEEGVLIPPSPFEAYFLSTAHFEISQKEWEDKFQRVFKKLRV
jgi:glutamate-1-semialdehyde 2,1-aminomutase